MIDLESLRCFSVAATTLNFRAASARVALSPGAFSERLRSLEEELGTPLFHRTTRKVRMTDAGLRLLPHARRLLADAERCRELAGAHDRPVPFALTLGTRFELGLSWLCPALTALRSARPERTLHLYMADTPDLMARTERGDIDGVLFSARLTSPRLQYTTIHAESYAFVGTQQAIRCAEDAARTVLVDVSPDLPLFRYLVDALPDSAPWRFARHEYMGGIGAVRHRIREGIGVGVLPTYFVDEDLHAGRLVRLLPDLALKEDAFRLVWREGHPMEAELQALAEDLRRFPLC